MPPYNISVESVEVPEFSAEQVGNRVDIEGNVLMTVSNSGVAPVFTRVSVGELEVGDEVILEGKNKNVGLVTDEAEVQLSFEGGSESTKFVNTVRNSCVSGTFGNPNGSVSMNYTVSGLIKAIPAIQREVTDGIPVESTSCNISTGGSGGNGGNGDIDPIEEGTSLNINSAEIAGTGVDVTISTAGVESNEQCIVDVQLVDTGAEGTASDRILDNKEKTTPGNFSNEVYQFRDLGAEAGTEIRADVNMLMPDQLYRSTTVTFEGDGGGFLSTGSGSVKDSTPSMTEASGF